MDSAKEWEVRSRLVSVLRRLSVPLQSVESITDDHLSRFLSSLDSIQMVVVAAQIEKEFEVTFAAVEVERHLFMSVDELLKLIVQKIAGSSRGG